MIVEEAAEYLAEMRANDLAPIFLAAPTSPDARLKAIAAASLATGKTGFVYAISRVGITGTQDKIASRTPRNARSPPPRLHGSLPIAVGFGISTPEHVRAVAEFADAAIIGSALVALIERTAPADAPKAVGDFIRTLAAPAQ